MEDYEVLETLGGGHQGQVEKIKKVSTGEIYTLKTFSDPSVADREIEILRTLSIPGCHPLILCYKGAIDLGLSIGMLTEYVAGHNLNDVIRYGRGVTDDQLIKLSKYIFTGLAYIHSKGIIHNDISLENFIFDDHNLKIIDYGMACFYRDGVKYLCEPEKTTDNLFELETGEVLYNHDLYPGIDVIVTGIMLWKIKNPDLGTTKHHYFVPTTDSYRSFISNLEKAPNRSSYYMINAPGILEELQHRVDQYSSGTSNKSLERIFRRATLVDPYVRPSASDIIDLTSPT